MITFRQWAVLQYKAFIDSPLGYIGTAMILAGVLGMGGYLLLFWYPTFPRNGLEMAAVSFCGGWAIIGIEVLRHRRKERLRGKP